MGILKRSNYFNPITGLLAGLLVAFLIIVTAHADPVITQGYSTNQTIPSGAIVSISKLSNSNVVMSDLSNANSLLGVVIASNNAQVSLTSGSGQVQVATSGLDNVLVSDINGKITAGDSIAASPITGVGMLATDNGEVIGSAQSSFPNATASQQIVSVNGAKQTVNIGSVPVLVSVGYYTKRPVKTLIPQSIQNLADAIAGKPVKTLPIIVTLVIFVLTLIAVVSIIYSLIHGSIISVGRNPMAQAAVYRNVIQLSSLVVIIVSVAIVAMYLILTRVS